MSVSHVDFISGSTQRDKTEQDFSLCYAYPVIDDDRKTSEVLAKNKGTLRVSYDRNSSATEDGLYVSENPLTNKLIKPYQLDDVKQLDYESRPRFCGKLVEIAIREIRIDSPRESDRSSNAATIEIVSVSILFKGRPICKANGPFNRKLYKLMIRDSECHDLSIQVHSRHEKSSILPLPLPQRSNVKDHVVDIDFAIGNGSQRIHAGIVACTISLSTYGGDEAQKSETVGCCLYRPSNDPNDPQNGLSLLRPQRRRPADRRNVKYFLLEGPALIFDTSDVSTTTRKTSPESKSLDIVVTEQPAFALLDVSFKNLFRANRPLRPSSSAQRSRHRNVGRAILTVNVLRGVEVPVREESALVSPLLEVEWGNVARTTSIADGPAPIWQQTLHFELPRQNTGEHCVKFRLFDQHPVWGQQWLGEARIPLERHRNYQELERWIALSPLFSPVLLFGYAQASPGQSHTRIYVLMRLEQPGNSMEANTIDTLSKAVQRCLAHPYKILSIETPDDAARFVMLLSSLSIHYGPVTPRQALNVNKVDHYGRAALLATLLQGFDLHSYVLLGSSQISKWTAFVLTIKEDDVILWDPEIGEHYKLSDSRCSLMKVSRLINHSGIWENTQRSILPHNLKYNVTLGKDWRPLVSVATSSSSNRPVQTLELAVTAEDGAQEKESESQMEQYLRDKLSALRSSLGLTTIFNRHAVSVLRGFISDIPNDMKYQLDKRDLKQLFRAYHTHGFVLNLRQTTLEELAEQITTTKVHDITGPVEFALVCHIQRYVDKICSIWIALAILRAR
ncbi:coiled-coil and C2 domain-containing protein 2A-like [Nylanderia fulva]|uniref:coiled-coil and C2 domain-containing protein 2A-like n=1 Tax=Nylanderia fulva TaxID=613905 RepID=UPI0010FB77A0|nr:coiled-coil and C2 domain-containing protein 2A-like [Nylanderia fulva]